MDKLSYALGLGIGRQLAQMGAKDMNIDDFAMAIRDVIEGNDLKVTNREAQTIVNDYFQKQEEKMRAELAEKGKEAKEAGEKYLAENAKKEGVVTLPSGLQYQVLRRVTDASPRQPTVWCATMRVCLSTALCSTAVFSAANQLHSVCSKLLPDGQRVCNSCRRVQSIVFSSPISWDMAKVVPDRVFLPSQLLSSTWNLSKLSKQKIERLKN